MSYKYSDRRKGHRFSRIISVERILFTAFVVTFVILLGVQAALLNPGMRASVSIKDTMEGAPLGSEESLYTEGMLELRLLDEERNSLVKILINGEEAGTFDDALLAVPVIQGDVLEIDASLVEYPVQVSVESVSEPLDRSLEGEIFRAEGNIVKIGKIRMDK